MKFTPSPIAGGMSGSAGSLTASRNRYGQYFRVKTSPVNPNTLRQQAVRSIFGSLVNLWTNTLTAGQRTGWETYAANTPTTPGGDIFLTGQNWFIGNNSPRLQAGLTAVANAPTTYDTGAPITAIEATTTPIANTIGIDQSGAAMLTTFLITGGASDDGDLLIYLGAPQNPSRNFFKGPYQLADVLELANLDTSEAWTTAFASLLNANGSPTAGTVRGIRARIAYDDGRLSQAYEALLPVEDDAP